MLPNESAIASAGAEAVWSQRLAAEAFPSYVGRQVFEDVVRQAWLRGTPAPGLPAVAAWGRWEGQDRQRRAVELDLVARLLDDRVLTGSVKFQQREADARVFLDHLDALRRLADSGQRWAHAALAEGAPQLFACAGGFAPSFRAVAADSGFDVRTWTLADLYRGASAPPAAA